MMHNNSSLSITGLTWIFKINAREDEEDLLLDELEEKGCKYVSDWVVDLNYYSNLDKGHYTENELIFINIKETTEPENIKYTREEDVLNSIFYRYSDKKPEGNTQKNNFISYRGESNQILKTLGLQIQHTKKIVGKTYVLKDIKISEGVLVVKDKISKDLIIKIEIPSWTSYKNDTYENFGKDFSEL